MCFSSYHFLSYLILSYEVERAGSPPRMPPPPPLPSRVLTVDPYIEEQERQREERLARILQMERELALLRSREGDVLTSKTSRPPAADPHDRDVYVRRSPGPHSSLGPPSYQSAYSRDRDNGVYGADAGGADRSRGYYGHNSPPREYTTRGYTGRGGTNSTGSGSFREPVAYPTQFGTSNNSRYGSNNTGGYGNRGAAPSVGYGGSASGSKSKSNLPPGWPSSDKPVNQPPFSVGGPWS